MDEKYEKYLNGGNGYLIIGIIWLIFWLGPAFDLFVENRRWGHNFALPIMFITVGMAYNTKTISCNFIAVIASFLTVPTLLGFWSWSTATKVSIFFLVLFILFFFAERASENELINPNPRFKAWLKRHLLTFAYLGLAHMTLIFFLVRWYNPEPFELFLPPEHHASTTVFNIMLLILVTLSIMERFVAKIGRVKIPKAAFVWSIFMIIVPLIVIMIFGD